MADEARNTEKWPIFICYRQADGQQAAARTYSLLNELAVPVVGTGPSDEASPAPVLDVYFDQAAPGVSDWTAVHEPFLKRARAMILICTPGAMLNEGADDWVHHEIDWWLQNRTMAPILVDPLGQNLRYVPKMIAERWPNAQRIRLREDDWDALGQDAKDALESRIRDQFLGAIVPSSNAFYRQELEVDRARTKNLQRTRRTMGILTLLLAGVFGAAAWIFMLKERADALRQSAEEARTSELAARQLAEARLIENQAVRAATEARLFDYLQQFDRFSAYLADMRDWENDFRNRARELEKAAQPGLPECHVEAEFSVYEQQLIGVEPDPVSGSKWLWFYLAVVPGQSPRAGDWAPAVLDVFAARPDDIAGGRELSRPYVKEQIETVGIPKNEVWSFVVGLAGGNYFTLSEDTYKVTITNINMNDEGDIAMSFELCKESAGAKPATQD